MAKTNGSSRNTRATNRGIIPALRLRKRDNYPEQMSEDGWNRVLDELQRDEYPTGWQDIDSAHRELALMQSGFTGLVSDDTEEIIAEISKDSMRSYIYDALVNQWTGYGVDNDIMITVGYKDGRALTNEEITPAKPIGKRTSLATQSKILEQTAFGRNVDFVMVSGAWGAEYWAQGKQGLDRIKT